MTTRSKRLEREEAHRAHIGREEDEPVDYELLDDAEHLLTGHPEDDDEWGNIEAALYAAEAMRTEAIEAGIIRID